MAHRLAAWSLCLVFVAQLINLWPLPGQAAAQRIAFWSKLKSQWEATDPAKSETPEWTAKAKSESLAQIDGLLADPGTIVREVRMEWALWLVCVVLSGATAIAALRGWRHWRWLVFGLLALYMWLQQPWFAFGAFFPEGHLNVSRGIEQVKFMSQFPNAFTTLLVFNVAVPVALVIIAGYALWPLGRRNRHAL